MADDNSLRTRKSQYLVDERAQHQHYLQGARSTAHAPCLQRMNDENSRDPRGSRRFHLRRLVCIAFAAVGFPSRNMLWTSFIQSDAPGVAVEVPGCVPSASPITCLLRSHGACAVACQSAATDASAIQRRLA